MEKFGLDHLLRHAFAGAVFLLTVVVAYPTILSKLPHLEGSQLVTIGTGAVLLCGSLIYTLHRALLLPFFYWLLTRRIWRPNPPILMQLDLRRFRRRITANSLQKDMAEWASHVHFLYCVAWAILLGLLSGYPFVHRWGPHAGWRFSMLAAITFAIALFHNWRYLTYEHAIEKLEPPPTP